MIKAWPSGHKPARSIETLVREGVSQEPEAIAATEKPDGEVMTYSTSTSPQVSKFKPREDRRALQRLLEGEVDFAPVSKLTPSLPTCANCENAMSQDFALELQMIDAAIGKLEKQMCGSIEFPSSARGFLGVHERPSSLSDAIHALERSVLFCDAGSATELLARVRKTRAAVRVEPKAADGSSQQAENLASLTDKLGSIEQDEARLRIINDRLITLQMVHSAARQNYTAISEAVQAAALSRRICVDIEAASKHLTDLVSSDATAFHALSENLRKRWRDVISRENGR